MSRTRSILIGAFVIGGLLLFALGLFLIGDRRLLFTQSVYVNAEFAGLAGLANGAKVRVGGMDAGEVVEIAVPPGPEAKFRVRARVIEKLHPLVRTDSVATIQNDGIVGSKFLQIDPGSPEAAQIADGGTIQSREPFEFSDLMVELRETIVIANRTIEDLKDDVETALGTITETVQLAQGLISETGDDIKVITAAGGRISADVQAIVADMRAGRGTAGKLLNDDQMYNSLRAVTTDLSQVSKNVRSTSEDVQSMVADIRSRDVAREIEKTVQGVQQLTSQLNKSLAGLQPEDGKPAMTADLRQTLAYARQTMENMAENTEALKRNWFFRGFFRDRGFYDLNSVTLDQYTGGDFAKGRQTTRQWLPYPELFSVEADGSERLTDEGKARIDNVMAEFLRYPRDSIIVVEGYASEGNAADHFLASRSRAALVREYVVKKYGLNPRYVGTMPMGAVASEGNGPYWDGVGMALFYEAGPVRNAGTRGTRTAQAKPRNSPGPSSAERNSRTPAETKP